MGYDALWPDPDSGRLSGHDLQDIGSGCRDHQETDEGFDPRQQTQMAAAKVICGA